MEACVPSCPVNRLCLLCGGADSAMLGLECQGDGQE